MPGESAGVGGGYEPEEVPSTPRQPKEGRPWGFQACLNSWLWGELGQDPSSQALASPCVHVCLDQPSPDMQRQKTPTSYIRPGPRHFIPSWMPPPVLPASGLPLQVHLLHSSQRDGSNHISNPTVPFKCTPLPSGESPTPQLGN